MTAEILPIKRKPRFEPVPDVVEALYKLLEAAKKGELRAVAFATVVVDQKTSLESAGSGFVLDAEEMFPMSHALATLNRRWGRYCDGEPD